MGLFDFLKPQKEAPSELDSAIEKTMLVAFPGGRRQMEDESAQLHALLRGSLSKSEAQHLLIRTKTLLLISKDKSEARITQSILGASEGKLTPHEAKRAYQFFTGVSGELYAGGNGTSEAEAVVISATTPTVGIHAEYQWIEQHYGKRDVDWTCGLRFHRKADDGKSYETFQINPKDGSQVNVVFDIYSFYGRGILSARKIRRDPAPSVQAIHL